MAYCLIYVSKETSKLSRKEVESLTAKSSENNKEKNITGILIYNSGYFLQYVEGDEKDVHELIGRVSRDIRHEKLKVIYETNSAGRLFPGWTMEYVDYNILKNDLMMEIEHLFEEDRDEDLSFKVYSAIARIL